MRLKHLLHSLSKTTSGKFWSTISFVVIGLASTAWFLVRVIPKPSRANYPCMRAAAPFMSSFVIYLLTLGGASLILKKFPAGFRKAHISLTVLFFVIAFAIPGISTIRNQQVAQAVGSPLEDPNTPMGEAKGIYPGRVVWYSNPDATDQNCPNTFGKAYFMDTYTNQDEVDKMLNGSMKQLTGKATVKEAWDEVFKYHNNTRGKGEVSYKAGEKIFIKVNRTSSWGGNFSNTDLARNNNNNYAICETAPQVVTAVLRHLVNEVGVAQSDIMVGDPMKHLYKDDYEKFHAEFPEVTYFDISKSTLGRTKVVKSTTAVIDYSDRGEVLREGDWNSALTGNPIQTDKFYTMFEEMEYLINLPTLKAHIHAGITMFAKNHFGSQTRDDAKHLHGGLISMGNDPKRNTYGQYRVQVDLMGHELTGKKNLIYIMDALYSSEHEIEKPVKWEKAPWNNDWTSSLFVSLDPVAIESVGFDFLRYEYDGESGKNHYNFPHYGAVDDYLHQAADKANWPAGITYDPENDGSEIGSLGVHEHWNNPTDMQYSRNLGTGEGIELVKLTNSTNTSSPFLTLTQKEINLKLYPNPVQQQASISYQLALDGFVSIEMYTLEGRKVASLPEIYQTAGSREQSWDASGLSRGHYLVQINARTNKGMLNATAKFQKY
jgi:hypothetical protein